MRKVLFLSFLLGCCAFSLCAGPKAQWIIYPEKEAQSYNQERYFRTEFKLPRKKIKQAILCYLIDDYGSITLNGQSVSKLKRLTRFALNIHQYDVTEVLKSGANVLVTTAVNEGGPGGFIARLEITYQDGNIQEIITDAAWKTSRVKSAGCENPGFAAREWTQAKTVGDYNSDPWVTQKDMLAFFSHNDGEQELKRRQNMEQNKQQALRKLAAAPTEQAKIVYKDGGAFFDIGGKLYRPVLYNYSTGGRDTPKFRQKMTNFSDAGINLIVFSIEAHDFWKGPRKYDYKALDKVFATAYSMSPNARFMFAITFSHGPHWWNKMHPKEMIKYARQSKEFESDDNIGNYEAPSYASELWVKEACETVKKLVEHIEKSPYGKRVFAYRLAAGVYSEWHYYGMADSMPDVSAPMTKLFRTYLKDKYKGNVAALRKAWNQPSVTFETATPPPAKVRLQYVSDTLRDPVKHAWSIDFLHCIQLSLKNALLAMNKTAKEACKGRALIGNYCGYFFGMGYTAEGWHLVNDEFMRSPYVDFQVSPCCYSTFFRGLGSTQLSRSLTASYKLHNKIGIFEADTRTYLTENDVNNHAKTAQESVAMLSRDLAQAISKGCAYWYYDFGYDWYNDPEILRFFHKINPVYDAVKDFSSSAEIAVITDWESAYYHAIQAPYGGITYYSAVNYIPQDLKRAGLQFDAYPFADLNHPALQNYKLYIFPQLVYMTPEKLAMLAKLKKAGKTLLFLNTPGWLTAKGQDADSIFKTTGIRAKVLDKTAQAVTSLTHGSTMSATRGGPVGRWDYAPVLSITDSQATTLGTVRTEDGKKVNSYARKKNPDGSISYVSGSPFMSIPELRRIAKEAGVHCYCESDKGVVFANNSMISFHTGTPGKYTLKAKQPVTWTMVYPEKKTYPNRQAALTFEAPVAETYIFAIKP